MVWDGMLFGIYACGGLVYLFVRSCVVAVRMQMQLRSELECAAVINEATGPLARRRTIGDWRRRRAKIPYGRDCRVVNKPRKKLEGQSQKPEANPASR